MIKPVDALAVATEKPFNVAAWATSMLNALLSLPVVFHWWQPEPDQLSLVTLIANLMLQLVLYLFLQRVATPRASPTAADGSELVSTGKPRTRGIEKG